MRGRSARKLPEAAPDPDPGITPVQAGCGLTFDLETADAGDLFTYRPYDETGFIRLAGMITPGGGPEIVPVPELINHLNSAGEIRGHNILGFDGLALAFHAGLDWEQFAAKAVDTELVARQADPPRSRESGSSEDRYGLSAVAQRLGLPGKTDDLSRLKRKHGGYDKIPLDDPEFRAYLEGDLAATAAVADAMEGDDYTRREHQVAALAGRMTLNGFAVDVPLLRERQRELADRKAAALDQLATGYGLPLAKTVMRGRGKARHEETEALTAPLAAASGREWLAGIYERYGCTNPPRTSHGELAIGRRRPGEAHRPPEVPGRAEDDRRADERDHHDPDRLPDGLGLPVRRRAGAPGEQLPAGLGPLVGHQPGADGVRQARRAPRRAGHLLRRARLRGDHL